MDRLNESSYAVHYRSLEKTELYARKALALSDRYPSGRAEALNNLAFVSIARMDYRLAARQLDSVAQTSDNQVELLIADIQRMRLCQRQAQNKEFYDYKTHAMQLMRRIAEEKDNLSPHLAKRLVYAKSEYAFVASTYFYYVGLSNQSREAAESADREEIIQKDTAQYLNWLYQIGSGGILRDTSRTAVLQKEYDLLIECWMIAREHGYTYWEANAMQSLAEHLFDNGDRAYLRNNNAYTVDMLNADSMPDSLLAGYLAQKSADMFSRYGDVYQTAGSLRTLAKCFWGIGDNKSALYCLNRALSLDNGKTRQTPELVASIREQLSIVYSALNDKHNSDINRNIYLDMQEKTRQDMELDARAAQLERTSGTLNTMILAIVILIILLSFLIYLLLKKKDKAVTSTADIDSAVSSFLERNARYEEKLSADNDELNEKLELERYDNGRNKRRNIENRSKVFLVESVKPLIDRIANEIERLKTRREDKAARAERYEYIRELTGKIEEYNDVLTEWIKLRQGEIGVRVESFPLSAVLDTVRRGRTVFSLQGISLEVEQYDFVVKADRILTLFMINTIADNARKFTPKGGTVRVSAADKGEFVEISVSDNGKGIAPDELKNLFCRGIKNGHGFGLLNCKGILDRYKKYSNIFAPCTLEAESTPGKGSRFFFTLPKGAVRMITALFAAFAAMSAVPLFADGPVMKGEAKKEIRMLQDRAAAFADSTYFCNIDGRYASAIDYADSTIQCLNALYLAEHPKGKCLMQLVGNDDGNPAEIQWLRSGFATDYTIILSIRNESAVAALALHRWNVYGYNNAVYTKLFKAVSADNSLGEYCQIMQKSETDKNIAVTILIVLLCVLLAVCYVIYYRKTVKRHSISDMYSQIRGILAAATGVEAKLEALKRVGENPYYEEIAPVYSKVRRILNDALERQRHILAEKAAVEETVQQTVYENHRLYVSNNILENCLSAIKHETMYYPSRIKMFVGDNGGGELDGDRLGTLGEIVEYYRELYFTLCLQLHSQVETAAFACGRVDISEYTGMAMPLVYGDAFALRMLFDILRKQNGGEKPVYGVREADGKGNVVICAEMNNVPFSGGSANSLFVPGEKNLPFMVCRQIIRETENATNHYGCGITAESNGGRLRLVVTLPLAVTVGNMQNE